MSRAPSCVTRRPASLRRRCFAASFSTVVAARSKRSCTAVATLLTFWPPGPEARMKASEISLCGIASGSLGMVRLCCAGSAPAHSVLLIGVGCDCRASRQNRIGTLENADLALRDRNLDVQLLKDAPDRAVDIGAHIVDAIHGIGDPEAHLKAHAVILEAHEPRHRLRLLQNSRMILRRLKQRLHGHFRIILIAD